MDPNLALSQLCLIYKMISVPAELWTEPVRELAGQFTNWLAQPRILEFAAGPASSWTGRPNHELQPNC